MEHPPSPRLPSSRKSYEVARRRDRELREEKSWRSGTHHDDDGFAALAQLESPRNHVKGFASRGLCVFDHGAVRSLRARECNHWVGFGGAARRQITGEKCDLAEQKRNREIRRRVIRPHIEKQTCHDAGETEGAGHPATTPIAASVIPCLTTSPSTSLLCAPSAMRMPISCVRC